MQKTHDPSWKGGTRCTLCSHPKAEAINRDVLEYFKCRSGGHEMPWSVFHREWLVPEYKIAVSDYSTRKHALRCLRIEE